MVFLSSVLYILGLLLTDLSDTPWSIRVSDYDDAESAKQVESPHSSSIPPYFLPFFPETRPCPKPNTAAC